MAGKEASQSFLLVGTVKEPRVGHLAILILFLGCYVMLKSAGGEWRRVESFFRRFLDLASWKDLEAQSCFNIRWFWWSLNLLHIQVSIADLQALMCHASSSNVSWWEPKPLRRFISPTRRWGGGLCNRFFFWWGFVINKGAKY